MAGRNWWQLKRHVRGLTLRAAWHWSGASLAVLVVSAAADAGYLFSDPAGQSFVRLLAAVMLLTPAVSVLGARRPGAAAWPWFVVLPLVVVLMWPAVSQLVHLRNQQPLELSLPAFAAVLLVLLMSYGNFFGTGQKWGACLLGVSVVVLLLPGSHGGLSASGLPAVAALLLALSSTMAIRRLNSLANWRTTSAREAADRVWLLFRDSYGLVWATRVALRVNQFAERERWEVQLTLEGFRAFSGGGRGVKPQVDSTSSGADGMTAASCLTEAQLRRPLEVLCWVLKRFASQAWLENQLGRWLPDGFGESADRRGDDGS